MSVCLGIIKTVGVTTLGIYTGMVTTSSILLFNRPCKEIFGSSSSSDEESLAKRVVCRVSKTALALLTVASSFLAAAYFHVPESHKHPYVLYGALVGPVTFAYGLLLKGFCPIRGCHASASKSSCCQEEDKSAGEKKQCPVSKNTTEDSTSASHCPFAKVADKKTATNLCPLHFNISTHLIVLSLISTVGFAQSVFGLYGEGMFI